MYEPSIGVVGGATPMTRSLNPSGIAEDHLSGEIGEFDGERTAKRFPI